MPFARPLRRILNTTGFDLVRTREMHTLSTHLREVIRRYRVETILDVGANEGQFAGELRALGFLGEIHSFEPVQSVFERLKRRTASDPLWTAHNLAMGAAPGKLQINVSTASVFSSFLPLSDDAKRQWPASHPVRQEDVEVSTIDDFLKSHRNQSTRILLKMDTQGFDLEVFKGALNSLDRIAAVSTEISFTAVYDGTPSYSQSIDAIRSVGFSVSGIYPVVRVDDLSLREADCVFVSPDMFRPGAT
jgi:FkbM family methyltransferase